MLWTLAVLAVAIPGSLISYRLIRRRVATRSAVEKAPDYRAVTIVSPSGRGCAAFRAVEGHTFLCAEAPLLPLAGCTANACDCLYRHHADRRHKPRRAADAGLPSRPRAGSERRRGGRRAEDEVPTPAPVPEIEGRDEEAFTYFEHTDTITIRALRCLDEPEIARKDADQTDERQGGEPLFTPMFSLRVQR